MILTNTRNEIVDEKNAQVAPPKKTRELVKFRELRRVTAQFAILSTLSLPIKFCTLYRGDRLY